MANMCSFIMLVKGKKENIQVFKEMMSQEGTVFMGRGAEVLESDFEELENGLCRCKIIGSTKWSVVSSLVDNAISMRTNISRWNFGDTIDKTKLSFVTLFEACEQLNLDMECYSEEAGIGFQEHFLFVNGELVKDECVEYSEEYDEDEEEWTPVGGFENWDFII